MADTKIGYIHGDADYLAIIYLWDIARDLDTCTYIKSPSIPILRDDYGINPGYFAPTGYGWDHSIYGGAPIEITTNTPYIMQGLGDRTNNDPIADPDSIEATIINIAAIKKLYTDHPDLKNKYPYFDISSNIHWYSNGEESPSGIDIKYDLFKGGSIWIDTDKHTMTPTNSTHVAGSSFSSIYKDTIHNIFQMRIAGFDSTWSTGTANNYDKIMGNISNRYYYNAFTLRLDMSDPNNVQIYIIHGMSNALSTDDLCALSLFGTDIFNGDIFNGKIGSKYIKDTDWHEVFGHTNNDPVSNTPSSKGVRIGDLLNGTLEIAPVNGYPSTSFGPSRIYNPDEGNIWPVGSKVHVDNSINTNITEGRILRTGDIIPYSIYLSEYGKQQDPNKLVTKTDLTLRNNMSSLITTSGVGALLYDLDLINVKKGGVINVSRSDKGLPAPEAVYYAVQGDGNIISSIKKFSSADIKNNGNSYTVTVTSDMILKTNNGTRSRVLLFVKMPTGESFPKQWQYWNNNIYAVLMPNGFTTADNACLYHNDQIRYIVCSSDLVTLISDCFAAQANLKQIYFLSPNAPALKIGDGRGYTFVDSVNSTVPNSNVTINYVKFSEGWTSGDPNSAWSWAGVFNPNNYSNYKNIAANISTWKLHELGYNSTMYSIWNNIIWNGEI